jgi:hypothetical protein
MARMSSPDKIKLLRKTLTAWERLRPTRSYSGITLEEFRQAVQACFEARAEIDDARLRLRQGLMKRERRDLQAMQLRERLGFAIQGDPAEPRPSDFHVAIGYVPRELRRRGRRRKRKATAK